MSGGKKRSGFQITSVTSDFNNQTPAGQSAPSVFLSVVQSAACPQGSSSQPSTPSLKRKFISQDASGHGMGTSRFRVVRLAGGAGGAGWGESYRRGRWTCMDLMERQQGAGFRRVMDSMRHAHSLESLEMIGRDKDRGGVYSHDREGGGLVLHSGPPSPTHQQPISIRLLDHNEPMGVKGLDSTPPPPSPRPRNVPPPSPIGRRCCRAVCPQAVSLSAQLPPCWTVSDPHSDPRSLQSGPNHLPPAGGRQFQ
ncbi:TSC22 domain family protein 2 isoform X2 [Scomber scombrus]|uniref:TSC22 domain family protein 2 isoform X2 n=1 Tax=Scomber scombrus TaxID=13677 RepID=UPI002DDB4819|nr:TSC22 domain family protein 2 isoform X2 [Scomber scombrus]